MENANHCQALRDAIKASGLTYAELAERAGYTRGYRAIWPYVSGSRPMGDRVRERLEQALGLHQGALIGRRESGRAAFLRALRSFLATPHGGTCDKRERLALTAVLPHFSAPPSNDALYLIVIALRLPRVPEANVPESIRSSKS